MAAQVDLLDEVLMQLVRDTNNPSSSMHYHSLLEDMYGIDGWVSEIPLGQQPLADLLAPGNVPNPSPAPTATQKYTVRWPDNGVTGAGNVPNVTGGQILEFDVVKFNNLYEEPHLPHGSPGDPQNPPYPHAANEFSPLDDAYAGQVLTFTSGPARGVSTRIVGSRFTQTSGGNWLTLRVMAFKLAGGDKLPGERRCICNWRLAGARILVNGRPFNGTGAGFNPTPNLDGTTAARSDTVEPFQCGNRPDHIMQIVRWP